MKDLNSKKKSVKDFVLAGKPILKTCFETTKKIVAEPVNFYKNAFKTIFADDEFIKSFLESSGLKKKINYEKENYELLKKINENLRAK